MKRKIWGMLLCMALCQPAWADDTGGADLPRTRMLLGGGLTTGGDELYRVTYADGHTDRVMAGGWIQVFVGVDHRLNAAYALQVTLGRHFDSTTRESHGEVTFSRIPLELLAYYYVHPQVRVGGGLRMVRDVWLRGSGVADSVQARYHHATGGLIEAEYLMDRSFGFKLRHVWESYKDQATGGWVRAPHLGLLVNFYF